MPDPAGGPDGAALSGSARGGEPSWDSAVEWDNHPGDFAEDERDPGFFRGLGSSARARSAGSNATRTNGSEPGLASWAAVLLLIVISAIGATIDEANGNSIRGWFDWSLVIGSLLAILAVKRSGMFGVVVAPPLVYFVASAAMLYFRSGGLKDRKVLIDAAANWLVYGFPAIAGATAVVLVIAGIRMIIRR